MFKHAVTYIDFNNVPHNEDLYFHMMVPEWADLEFNPMFDTSLSNYIKEGMGSGEGRKIHTVFKLLVANSYGRRSEDGSKFSKDPQWTEDFFNSNAWEQFFLWLTEGTEGKNGQVFFNSIFPESMRSAVEELQAKQESTEKNAVTPPKKITELSRDEMVELLQKRAAGVIVQSPLA